MKNSSNIFFVSSVIILGLLSSGTRGCQEDYDLASYADSTPTPSPTPTTSPTPTPTPTPTPSPTTSAAVGNLNDLFRDAFVENTELPSQQPLGKMRYPFYDADREDNLSWASQWKNAVRESEDSAELIDSDRDGFLDWFEKKTNTDPMNAASTPIVRAYSLVECLAGRDNDGDGIPNDVERTLGLDLNNADSDEDGSKDGAEVISGSDPKKYGFVGPDADGDGLNDAYETTVGLNPQNFDTDGDGLRDDDEVALGANPFNIDTDSDGISDGREISLGGCPTVTD